MSYLHTNLFLFVVAVFTMYMLITGLRYLRITARGGAKTIDWCLTAAMLVFGLVFVWQGVTSLMGGNSFGYVMLTFGAISLLFAYQDVRNFQGRNPIKNFGLTTHLQRMVGSYVASVTAFLVTNFQFGSPVVLWLAPTAVLVPLIVVWSRKWKRV